GSMIYCLVEQLILLIPGFNPDIFKLIVAIMVTLVLAIPAIKNGSGPLMQKLFGRKDKKEVELATEGADISIGNSVEEITLVDNIQEPEEEIKKEDEDNAEN
ncbi:MAG: hypothetical protein IKD35_00230, partial [Clostridia bacterium]|nr:hypothetical protein [Clostridia bacterium]